ncbi:uroporphyrinogen-III synthase [Pelistega europaea]|uniref:Uroporphyrinogen-III synthase n=1 Tax=Pelistega europaea TaxID=106147 RepID=A0A7Y4P419_9BURK|nr:uroporphyrinogen-III synthase [Pelistega europaea]NOL49632.1 uroporphyrinogen-III synthase [Pelistega europaea]
MHHLIVLTRPEAKNQALASDLLNLCNVSIDDCQSEVSIDNRRLHISIDDCQSKVSIDNRQPHISAKQFSSISCKEKSRVQILSMPALALKPFSWAELADKDRLTLENIHTFDAIFFVSAYAAECFFQLFTKATDNNSTQSSNYHTTAKDSYVEQGGIGANRALLGESPSHTTAKDSDVEQGGRGVKEDNAPTSIFPPLVKSINAALLCVGQSTRDYLYQIVGGQSDIISPVNGNDSEALWDTLVAQDRLKKLHKILIVRAETGRDWLQEQCQKYGIDVVTLPMYRRVPATLTKEQIQVFQSLPLSTTVQWLFTSSEGVEAMLPTLFQLGIFDGLSHPSCDYVEKHAMVDKSLLCKHHFWVIHQRIAMTLQQCMASLSHGEIHLSEQDISIVPAENTRISSAIARYLDIIG